MPVYVDDVCIWFPSMAYLCHLVADTDEELDIFARRLSLNPQWLLDGCYDITPGERLAAVQLGAIEISSLDMSILRGKLQQAKKKG